MLYATCERAPRLCHGAVIPPNALQNVCGRDPKPRRFDVLIAAVAVSLGVPLITRNQADFRGIHDALDVIAV